MLRRSWTCLDYYGCYFGLCIFSVGIETWECILSTRRTIILFVDVFASPLCGVLEIQTQISRCYIVLAGE